jgi:hypothetical protein
MKRWDNDTNVSLSVLNRLVCRADLAHVFHPMELASHAKVVTRASQLSTRAAYSQITDVVDFTLTTLLMHLQTLDWQQDCVTFASSLSILELVKLELVNKASSLRPTDRLHFSGCDLACFRHCRKRLMLYTSASSLHCKTFISLMKAT